VRTVPYIVVGVYYSIDIYIMHFGRSIKALLFFSLPSWMIFGFILFVNVETKAFLSAHFCKDEKKCF
jgi:hypothetical protein